MKRIIILILCLLLNQSIFTEETLIQEKEIIENFLNNNVPGFQLSYRDFFNLLIHENISVYLHGGAIRDLLSEPQKKPNDIDFIYSCSKEELIEILRIYGFRPVGRPDGKVIFIGSLDSNFLEAYSEPLENRNNPYLQDFTVNSVLYDLKNKKFIKGSKERINDIKNNRLRIEASDWDRWITQDNVYTPHYKIFRFFKMIGKGYCYQLNFERYMKKKIEELSKNPEEFKEYVLMYLSTHFSSLNELKHGAKTLMGEKWCYDNIEKYCQEILIKSKESEAQLRILN